MVKKRTPAFIQAILEAPGAGKDVMVFPFDYTLNDYNLESFSSKKFKESIQKTEVENMLKRLKESVTLYKVYNQFSRLPGYIPLITIILALIALFVLTSFGHVLLGLAAFVLIVAIGVLIACLIIAYRKNLLKNREKEVKVALSRANVDWAGRGMRWSTGRYGAYLVLTRVRSKEYSGGISFGGANRPLQNPGLASIAMENDGGGTGQERRGDGLAEQQEGQLAINPFDANDNEGGMGIRRNQVAPAL